MSDAFNYSETINFSRVERMESHIILKSIGKIKAKGLNMISPNQLR
jgi:hypothetical protein